MQTQALLRAARQMGATSAAIVDVAQIAFRREFRQACEQNACGKYGRCWTCPPDVGDIDELIAQAKTYEKALVYQSIGTLADSYDIEGMELAAQAHNRLALALAKKLVPLLGKPLQLAAGACHICKHCTRINNQPCRHPNLAVASLEAYGIAVSELAATCGMRYINGTNTVTYFGAFLYKSQP